MDERDLKMEKKIDEGKNNRRKKKLIEKNQE